MGITGDLHPLATAFRGPTTAHYKHLGFEAHSALLQLANFSLLLVDNFFPNLALTRVETAKQTERQSCFTYMQYGCSTEDAP